MYLRARDISILACLLSAAPGLAAHKEKPVSKSESVLINDSWYTMQAGSAPWGIFHEVIEKRDGKYSYRYNMTKIENKTVYQENIGALAGEDLTPIAFNLNKSGRGATETINATYSKDKQNGVMNIEVTGAKVASFKRYLNNDTILDVFFPVWLRKNSNKLRPKFRGWLMTFAEDPDRHDFRSRKVTFDVKGVNEKDSCLDILVELDNIKQTWCITREGVLIDLKLGPVRVRRAGSEAEAKSFLKGVMPKTDK